MNLAHLKAIGTLLISAIACLACAQECIAPVEYIAQDDDLPLGSYERVSPDGRYILRSFSGNRLGDVTLVELVDTPKGKRIVHHATPLKNEAFPVQGSWRYLVNTNGDHYVLKDILEQGVKAKPKFRGGMTGFYAAAAELPSQRDGEVRIRSFSWPNSASNSSSQGVGALSVRTLTIDATSHRITADTGAQFICKERRTIDGTQYGLPMISIDGNEFSAVPQSPRVGEQTMRVYSFGNDINAPKCEQRADLQFASGKATFGFPQTSDAKTDTKSGADLVFEYRGDVWWYNSALKESFNLASDQQTIRVGGFPGITLDGRIIVAASWLDGSDAKCKTSLPNLSAPSQCKKRSGYIVIDPYQSAAYKNHLRSNNISATKSCIKTRQ